MKLKDKIIKINNGNYEDFIAIRNSTAEKYSFVRISSIELDSQSIILMMEDNTFICIHINKLYKRFISLTMMESLQLGDIIDEDMCNKKTLNIRSVCQYKRMYNFYLGYKGYIFIGIKFEESELKTITYSDLGINYFPLYKIFFKKGGPVEKENNSAKLKELLSNYESPKENIKGGLMRASALPFVESLKFKDTSINFVFKPYQLDLGNGYKINMPKLSMKFCTNNKKFILNDITYIHPHISTNFVCLGTFQSVINSSRWNFDIALITMYEHACTYNNKSPFGNTRPFIEKSTNHFYSKCTFEYLGMTYTWEEFVIYLSARFENRKDFYSTIMGTSDTTISDWKSRFNITN